MSLRRLLCGVLLASLAVAAVAADRRITLDNGETLTLSWGADWVVGAPLPESAFGTVTIHGPDPTLWRMTLAPLPPHPTLTGDVGNLRIYVRNMARGLENGGVQVDAEQKSLAGAKASGFYFKAHDSRKKTKAQTKATGGDYTDGYTGALQINSRPYLFEVVWNKAGEGAANNALAALKTVRIQ